MKSKTSISVNQIFFKSITHYAITVIPLLAGVIAVFINPTIFDISGNIGSTVDDQNRLLIEDFLSISKLVLALMMSFFISYRWVSMEKDGSYGFWLALRVKREKFVLRTFFMFFVDAFFGIIAGVVIVLISFGGILSMTKFLILMVLLGINIALITIVAIFIGEIIQDPEISTIVFLGIFSLNYFFDNSQSSIFHKITKTDLHYADSNFIVPMILSIALIVVISLITLVVHNRKGIEI